MWARERDFVICIHHWAVPLEETASLEELEARRLRLPNEATEEVRLL